MRFSILLLIALLLAIPASAVALCSDFCHEMAMTGYEINGDLETATEAWEWCMSEICGYS